MGLTSGDDRRTSVSRYYDANTWKFLVTGSQRAIHRELWGPGVTDRAQALHFAHALVLDEIDRLDEQDERGLTPRRVLDLGCGVGTAALYLADRRSVEVVGVSISPEQVRLAQHYAVERGTRPGSVSFRVADFTDLPHDLADFDLAFAIESFVHADPAAAFFREAARVLRPGGALVVIDDVRTGNATDPRIEDFRAGWHAPSVLTVEDAAALAGAAGLEPASSRDLSGFQRLRRPRDRVVAAAQPLLRLARGRSLWADSMVGGHALQRCHLAGLLEYRLLRFMRPLER